MKIKTGDHCYGYPNGFKTTGLSLNVDYAPASNVLVRLEGRNLSSKDEVFIKETNTRKNNAFVTASVAISF
ncbi:outer membrane beta-barrel protein [Paraflavitalea speifideaquila]|uniref:outer membrane beta-barrel protein n=1 Tax=Paraflavitalea speifideaquila TaxID=3076558 RepID=UPI0028EFB091|nr:outer membrane beta-barrel protein [Paraflavitalea speifideiaquila]